MSPASMWITTAHHHQHQPPTYDHIGYNSYAFPPLHGKSRGRQEAAVHSLPLLQRAGSFAILSCGNPFQSTAHPATRHASNGRRFRQPCICAVTKLCCGASKQGLAACEPSVQQLQLRTHCASAHGHGFLQPKHADAGDGCRADCCLHLQHPEPG